MKKVLLVASLSMVLSGCFDDDDNDVFDEPNNAPEAVSEAFVTEADTPFSDQLTGTDEDEDPLVFSLVDEPGNGSVTIEDNGSFTYTPKSEFTGEDAFVFAVTDSESDPVEATITITVEAQQVAISSYVRAAFAQSATDEPLSVNGREFTQDVEDPAAFDDLLGQ
ncbi:Ig-like domain-containing protein [Alteromonas lipotrueiana]|uniref:Ig-like domain-containing protein n=1 Tax=Alteromonas lipotrueiana TaxID=2803815 RepID=UPI001C4978F9|nr:Ig-like domain-containing protein [Alteromonas lipotrueiana]